MKRLVSFVPSWTETLIEAGACVVGRTRFCIHPADQVRAIPAIGGTKDFDDEKLRALAPDLILMDREENTRQMYERASSIAPVHVSHVRSVRQMPEELRALATATELTKLNDFANRFELALARPVKHNDSIPATIKILKGNPSVKDKFVYVIWQNPWMAIGRETFIASMLEQAGFDLENMLPRSVFRLTESESVSEIRTLSTESANGTPFAETDTESVNRKPNPYPQLAKLPDEATILLSSEPYPFARKPPQLANARVALVDGERYSWFGVRALEFLETLT